MTTFHALELNKNNKYNSKESVIKRDVKIIIGNATIYVPSENNTSLLVVSKSIKLHKEAFVHSNQRSHYTSPIFQKLLKKYKLGQSMSRRGNCWDNAPQESFFGHMKYEINYKNCSTFEELQHLIDDYIDYYNHYRGQWNLKKLIPVQYRNQLVTV